MDAYRQLAEAYERAVDRCERARFLLIAFTPRSLPSNERRAAQTQRALTYRNAWKARREAWQKLASTWSSVSTY
jgi:hypothetical protein